MANRREQEKKQQRMVNARDWAKEQKTSWEATSVKLPEGVEWYKLEPGTHLLDFMPYTVGVGNPRADEGMLHFEREYTAHRIPMPNGKVSSFCCLWDTFKQKCPVCEYINTQGRNADPDVLRQLRGTTRHLWLVNDKPGDMDNPLKVLDTNHYNKKRGFGEQMVAIINSDEDYANFANLEGGYSVRLTVEEDTFPGGKYNVVTRIDFKSRKYNYDEDILERCPCLDEMILLTPYKELKKLLEQGESSDSDDEEGSEKPHTPVNRIANSTNGSAAKKAKPDPDEDDEPDEDDAPTPAGKGFKVGDKVKHEKHGLCKVLKVITPMKVVIEDEDDEEYTVSMNQLSAPPTKESKVPNKSVKKVLVDDDDDENDEGDSDIEEDEDDTPPVKAGKKKVVEPDEDEDDEPIEDEDQDEDDEDSSDEDSDDDDEPAPKKKPGRPARK